GMLRSIQMRVFNLQGTNQVDVFAFIVKTLSRFSCAASNIAICFSILHSFSLLYISISILTPQLFIEQNICK
ncbi:hypothetical protein AAHB54_22650, partial [Bacillus cereus]